VVEWFQLGERERVERVIAALRSCGVERLRTGVSWADYHRPGGEEWYQWLLPRLAAEFELLPCLHHTPPSLGPRPTIQSPPKRPRDFADFIDAFVDRFGRLFEWVELGNEPNDLDEWDRTLDPAWDLFCQLIEAAAYSARERGKRAALGGMCALDPQRLDLLARHGVLELVDAVGVHALRGSRTTVWRGWADAVERVSTALDRHGSRAAIWITEAGYSTWRHDETAQVTALVEALDAPADRVYWYAAEDLASERSARDGSHVDERQCHFGLFDAAGRPKLAARGLAAGGVSALRETAALARPRRRQRGPVAVVTGGAGFVGTNVAEALLAAGERVRVVDNLSRPGVEQNLRGLLTRHGERVEFVAADVRDRHALRAAVAGAASVFHFAAQVAVTTSVADPGADFDVNLGGTVALLEELRRLPDPPPILFTSTNKVYGTLPDVALTRVDDRWLPVDQGLRTRGIDERRPLHFCTPYGCSKGGADQYVLDWATTYGVPAAVFRMSCIYGRHQHGNEDQGWVAHFLIRALAGEPVTVFGDGAQVRDVLHASDLVRALLLVRERMGTLAGRVFNVGGGPDNTLSLLELFDLIEELHRVRPELRLAEERVGDQRWYVSDTASLRAATGWQPDVGVTEGVTDLYRWLGGTRASVAEVATA
jgi:CDP-paratose 2-epimerase